MLSILTPSQPFSFRDASRNVVDVGNLLMCRTCGSVIVVLFPICSLAQGKVLLETMGYLIQSLTVVPVLGLQVKLSVVEGLNVIKRLGLKCIDVMLTSSMT